MAPAVRATLLAAVVSTALGVPFTARAALFDDDEARARIEALRKQVEASQRVIDDRFVKIDERLKNIEGNMPERRAILDLASQIELLRGDIAKMRGQSEVLTNQIENADRRQKDLYVDI